MDKLEAMAQEYIQIEKSIAELNYQLQLKLREIVREVDQAGMVYAVRKCGRYTIRLTPEPVFHIDVDHLVKELMPLGLLDKVVSVDKKALDEVLCGNRDDMSADKVEAILASISVSSFTQIPIVTAEPEKNSIEILEENHPF